MIRISLDHDPVDSGDPDQLRYVFPQRLSTPDAERLPPMSRETHSTTKTHSTTE